MPKRLAGETARSITPWWQQRSQESWSKWCTLHSDTCILFWKGAEGGQLIVSRSRERLNGRMIKWDVVRGQAQDGLGWVMDLNSSTGSISAKHFISQEAHRSHQISVDEQVESVQDQSAFVRPGDNSAYAVRLNFWLTLISPIQTDSAEEMCCVKALWVSWCAIANAQIAHKGFYQLDAALKGMRCVERSWMWM